MPIVGVAEASRRLATSKSAIRKAIIRGTLAATRVPGGRNEYAISTSAIETYRVTHLRPGHRKMKRRPPQKGV